MKQIIYLTGFMGSGKSTIGPILANTLGWDFYDLDRVIEKKTGKKIRQIFEQDGENFFRKIETETLKELSVNNKVIISLGGGTIVSDENIGILKNSGKLIYLKIKTRHKTYPVVIGSSVLNQVTEWIKKYGLFKNLFIVVDENVYNLHKKNITDVFVNTGGQVFFSTLKAGEQSKSIDGLTGIIYSLVENNFGRD